VQNLRKVCGKKIHILVFIFIDFQLRFCNFFLKKKRISSPLDRTPHPETSSDMQHFSKKDHQSHTITPQQANWCKTSKSWSNVSILGLGPLQAPCCDWSHTHFFQWRWVGVMNHCTIDFVLFTAFCARVFSSRLPFLFHSVFCTSLCSFFPLRSAYTLAYLETTTTYGHSLDPN